MPFKAFNSTGTTHRCFWCGKQTTSLFWACETCSPIKEAAYKEAARKGLSNISDVYAEVFLALEKERAG